MGNDIQYTLTWEYSCANDKKNQKKKNENQITNMEKEWMAHKNDIAYIFKKKIPYSKQTVTLMSVNLLKFIEVTKTR